MKKLLVILLLLSLVGCAQQAEPPAAPEPPPVAAEEPSPVYTDWSKLTPYAPAEEIYSYHAGYHADGVFEPRDDYGALLPYIGKYAAMDEYVIDSLPTRGLVTDKGELVSGPVYAHINFFGEFLLLGRGDPEAYGGDVFTDLSYFLTLAAADGRWARELGRCYCVNYGRGLLMTADADGSLTLWNADGESVARFDAAALAPFLGEGLFWGFESGSYVDWTDDRLGYVLTYYADGRYYEDGLRLYLDFASGEILTEPPAGYPAEIDYSALETNEPEPPEIEGVSYLEPITDELTGETYFYGFCPGDGSHDDWRYSLFDAAGRVLVEDADLLRFETSLIVRAGLCSTLEDGCFCYRSLHDGSLVFRRILRTNSD